MADIKSLIVASLKTMSPDEQDRSKQLLAKIGIDVTQKELAPKSITRKPIPDVEEYNLEIFYHCTTCGSVTEQFFRMTRFPDNSGVFSTPLISRSREGIWKTEMRSIPACGQCYTILIARYTLEEMAKLLIKLGTKGIPIAEFLHGRDRT